MPEGWRSPLESDPNNRCNFSANQRTRTVCLPYEQIKDGDRTGLRIGRDTARPGNFRSSSSEFGHGAVLCREGRT